VAYAPRKNSTAVVPPKGEALPVAALRAVQIVVASKNLGLWEDIESSCRIG
jgi:hypothetical protein